MFPSTIIFEKDNSAVLGKELFSWFSGGDTLIWPVGIRIVSQGRMH